jgi:hypothetical protein
MLLGLVVSLGICYSGSTLFTAGGIRATRAYTLPFNVVLLIEIEGLRYGNPSLIFKSKYKTWLSKSRLYKTLITSVIAYGSEAWVMNKCDENITNIFEGKFLGRFLELSEKETIGEHGTVMNCTGYIENKT